MKIAHGGLHRDVTAARPDCRSKHPRPAPSDEATIHSDAAALRMAGPAHASRFARSAPAIARCAREPFRGCAIRRRRKPARFAPMKIAVIGSGISGLASAWLLAREHEVTLFEANGYFGGHTHTHEVEIGGRAHAVDTGFIVFNPANYPLLCRLFAELGVESQPTTMSFALKNERSGLEYNATDLRGLFAQKRNLVSPRFFGMLRDITRFYRDAPALLDADDDGPTLAEFLESRHYGAAFRDDHLVPMASALWSTPCAEVLAFPARHLARFMDNHHMLKLSGRPQWRVVRGGSQRYVDALRRRWRVRERLACAVASVRRDDAGVCVASAAGNERFDHAVLACHGDQALRLLDDADDREREILGAMRYQANDTVLHTDATLLPTRRRAWAAWNALVPATPSDQCTVSYCMNLLQSLDAREAIVVSLNNTARIAPERILRRTRYEHPLHTHASVRAQRRKAEIQGQRRTWFAGAYWGFGFHEDGMRSAVDVTSGLGVRWP
jgi:predicted NAD/FAD-binding protein